MATRVIARAMLWGGQAAIIYGIYDLFGIGAAAIVGGIMTAALGMTALDIIAKK